MKTNKEIFALTNVIKGSRNLQRGLVKFTIFIAEFPEPYIYSM